jgi:hypothetical protein
LISEKTESHFSTGIARMSEESQGPQEGGSTNSTDALTELSDAIGDIVTGIPAPVRKNFIKAFSRLCTTVVEYPIALIVNSITEKRTESKARVRLIDTSAQQIAEQMRTDQAYARAAAQKFAQKIVRERVNLDQIAEIAAAELKSGQPEVTIEQPETTSISDDWLNAFENEAAQMSSEQMQLLFGKILAGEIRRPTSFSTKTIRMIAQLDNRAAALFKKFCSLAVSIYIPQANMLFDARIISMGNAGANSLSPYGLGFDSLNILQEYGLIISDFNSHMDYRGCIVRDPKLGVLPLTYQTRLWALVPKATPPPMNQEYRVGGVALTKSGKELLPIIPTEPDEKYTEALMKFFEGQGMVLTPVQQQPTG